MYNDQHVGNLLLSAPVKELRNSVNILYSFEYMERFGLLFMDPPCVCICVIVL